MKMSWKRHMAKKEKISKDKEKAEVQFLGRA